MRFVFSSLPRFCLAGMLGLPFLARAQSPQKFTISGTVTDAQTGESLIGAAVYLPKTRVGTSTNQYGFYSLTLPADSVEVLVSYEGFKKITYRTLLRQSEQINFKLVSDSELETVEVKGSRAERIEETTRMSTMEVPIAQIKQVPALFGEVDVLKTLQLLPGVQSGNEGSSGIYVRGGGPDQNLILLDGTPVYNASHLFGFFSVFNADALNHVELVKGGFPARYGGRLSSVLDISMKEGNSQKIQGEGSIGLVASKFTLEGPIKKDTASFIISARRTYIDLLVRPFMRPERGVGGYFFHDLNAKLNWRLSNRDRLFLSMYTGYDKFYFRYRERSSDTFDKQKSALGWGNLTTALRWNRIIHSRLFVNTHLTYTKYQFDIRSEMRSRYTGGGQSQTDYFKLHYLSNIRDLSLKTDFDFIPSVNHYIRFGGQYILHNFKPGAMQVKSQTSGAPDNNFRFKSAKPASEAGLYVEDDIRFTERLKVNTGLRLSAFAVDKRVYFAPEPRVSGRYFMSEEWALKASYARMNQYLHLLSNSGIGLPTDLWLPATKLVKPQRSDQVALGVARSLAEKNLEISVEAYYKWMQHIIQYRPGANFLGTTDNNWETKVTAGKGWA